MPKLSRAIVSLKKGSSSGRQDRPKINFANPMISTVAGFDVHLELEVKYEFGKITIMPRDLKAWKKSHVLEGDQIKVLDNNQVIDVECIDVNEHDRLEC